MCTLHMRHLLDDNGFDSPESRCKRPMAACEVLASCSAVPEIGCKVSAHVKVTMKMVYCGCFFVFVGFIWLSLWHRVLLNKSTSRHLTQIQDINQNFKKCGIQTNRVIKKLDGDYILSQK